MKYVVLMFCFLSLAHAKGKYDYDNDAIERINKEFEERIAKMDAEYDWGDKETERLLEKYPHLIPRYKEDPNRFRHMVRQLRKTGRVYEDLFEKQDPEVMKLKAAKRDFKFKLERRLHGNSGE